MNKDNANKSSLKIEQSGDTPLVHYDPPNDHFLIRGRSITSDPTAFYQPLIDWLKKNGQDKYPLNRIVVDLDYISSPSVPWVYRLIKTVSDLQPDSTMELVWRHDPGDEDSLDLARDFHELTNFEVKLEERP